jgi:hypothetical protein
MDNIAHSTFADAPHLHRLMATIKHALLFAAATLPIACQDNSLTTQSITRHQLRVIGDVMERISPTEWDNISTFESLLATACAKKMLELETAADYRVDAWRRKLKMEKEIIGERMSVRLLSAGKNGLFEGGAGDDHFVQVVFWGEKVVERRASSN